jgi:hypothetical protein
VERLSRLPFREHRAIRADPRFLELVGMAQVKLETRPKELASRELANILNGACVCVHAPSADKAWLRRRLSAGASDVSQALQSSGMILDRRFWRCSWMHAWR